MNVVQSFVMTSCALSIIFSIISFMVDTSKFEKEFRFLLIGVFSIILIKSILQLDLSFLDDISFSDNPYYTQSFLEDYTTQATKTTLEKSIKELLTSNGIACENISVDINITEKNCISINRVYLLADDFSRAESIISENFGNIEVLSFNDLS